jgi:hypothetical protein
MPEVRAIERAKITLGDGREYVLRYTLAAMKEAREEFGGPINSQQTLEKIDETNLGKLIWYGLRADYPEMTVEDVEALIEPPMFRDIMSGYIRAVSASLPDAPAKNEQSPAELLAMAQELLTRAEILSMKISTGSSSGALGDSTSDSQTPNSGDSHSESSQHLQSVTTTG